MFKTERAGDPVEAEFLAQVSVPFTQAPQVAHGDSDATTVQ